MKTPEVLLVHTMGTIDNTDTLHTRGLSIVLAAAYLAKQLHIPELITAGGHYWGDSDRLPLGVVTGKALEQQLKLAQAYPLVTILTKVPGTNEPVIDSYTELEALDAYAHTIGATGLASVSSDTHVRSLNEQYKNRGINATVYSAEQVLATIPDSLRHPLYMQMIREIIASEDEQSFIKRERIKFLLYRLFGLSGEWFLHEKAIPTRNIANTDLQWVTTITGRE